MSIIKGVGLWPSQYLSNLKAFPLALLQPQCERARTLFKLLHISEVSLFWLKQSRPINDKWYWARINYLSITALLVAVAAKAQTAFAEKFGTFYWALNTLNVRIYLQIRAKAMFFCRNFWSAWINNFFRCKLTNARPDDERLALVRSPKAAFLCQSNFCSFLCCVKNALVTK